MSSKLLKLPAFLLLVLSSAFFSNLSLAQGEGVIGLQERVISLFREHEDSLVRVKAVYPPKEGEVIPQVIIGSGFFISREGLIFTNASIVAKPIRVWVEHDNIAYSADVIGTDVWSNVALLRIHTLPKKFSFFHLVDSAELPPVGTFVLRLSMPLEFNPSPHFGMINGLESRFGERFFPCTYLRTTIPAGPGDGGSAYLDLNGKLLGIQVGSLPDVGSSYILPSRAALRIRDDLLFSGEVIYGWIGFEVDNEVSIDAGQRVIITEIFPETPASKAGLLPGDILQKIGDYSVQSLDDLRNAMFYTRVGQMTDVKILRDKEVLTKSVRLVERPTDEPLQIITPATNVPAEPMTPLKPKNSSDSEEMETSQSDGEQLGN